MIAGITEKEQKTIERILDKYSQDYAFFYYGSRVKGTYEITSDLDVLVKGAAEMPLTVLQGIKEEFDNSDLSYIVNFFDYYNLDNSFYERIKPDLIPYNWQEVKLGDICDVRDGTHDSPRQSEYGKYLITSKHIKSGKVDLSSAYKISLQDFNMINQRSKVDKWDILISMIGTVGEICLVSETPDFAIKNVGLIKTGNKHLAKFIYYYLKSSKAQNDILSRLKGTTQQYLSLGEIRNFPILLPPIEVQKKIAAVLNALDDKIELNNRINNNLEQQAQTLFDEQILKHKTLGNIGNYCSVKSGFAFKSSWWQDAGVKVIKIKNIEVTGLNLVDCSFVSTDKAELANDFIVQGGDLLIAMTGATIGKFAIVPKIEELLLVNQRVGKFFLGNNPVKRLPFIYCTLKQQEVFSEIINRAQGSAQLNISANDIKSISCIYPDNETIENFNNICRPYFEKIIANQQENSRLAQLRDTLLPKLMSGEIDVSNVNISTDKLSFTED